MIDLTINKENLERNIKKMCIRDRWKDLTDRYFK